MIVAVEVCFAIFAVVVILNAIARVLLWHRITTRHPNLYDQLGNPFLLGQPYAHLAAISKYTTSKTDAPDDVLLTRLKMAKMLLVLTALTGAVFLGFIAILYILLEAHASS